MAGFDYSLIGKNKSLVAKQQLQAEFELKKQLAAQKLAAAASGQDLPAALQLANEYQQRLQAGDVQGANLIAQFAKTTDKGLQVGADGTYGQLPGYADAIGGIGAVKKGMEQQAEKDVDVVMNPRIERATRDQTNQSDTNAVIPKKTAEGLADRANKAQEDLNASTQANPIIDQLKLLNTQSPTMAYADAQQPFRKMWPGTSPKEAAVDLLRQGRLELAAPLAKQLGVNPTDKDFQSSLDRIFDLSSTKESRALQIEALSKRIAEKQASLAGIANAGGTSPVVRINADKSNYKSLWE